MKVVQSLIAGSQQHITSSHFLEILGREASKGCLPVLSRSPVSLEPYFLPPSEWDNISDSNPDTSIEINSWAGNELERFNCWLSPGHTLEWFRTDRFIRELKGASHRIGFEITGNEEGITIGFLVHKNDIDLIKIAYNGEFQECELVHSEKQNTFEENISIFDFFPIPPYHHLLTQSRELTTSPYESFILALAKLPEPTQGFVQILFEPAQHNWHHNVEVLTNIEYETKTKTDVSSPYGRQQQLPSGELRNMANDVETKAHNDKPFYFTAIRAGLISTENALNAWPYTAFASLFQHGGQPLQFLTEQEYRQIISPEKIRDMFNLGLSYHPGFLLNSSELSGLVNLPSTKIFEEKEINISILESLPLPKKLKKNQSGIIVGTHSFAGNHDPVYISNNQRKKSMHIIGKPDSGKSILDEIMILQDIENDNGIAFIDPHGDSIKRLLSLIPEEKVEKTIYIDFGNLEWVPIWNPVKHIPGQNIGKTAGELVNGMKSIVQSNFWGDRLEHLMKNGFYGLLHLEDATLFDLSILLQSEKKGDQDRTNLVKRIKNAVDNEYARRFWDKTFSRYRWEDFSPPQNKLSKLLMGDESVSLMLSQPESLFNLKDIMDTGKILLFDLSNVGPDIKSTLGAFLLTLIHQTALSRSITDPENRKPFSIYCDEAHIIITDTINYIIAESRKFNINLTMSHQFLNQFTHTQRDALLSVGTTVIFNVNLEDARFLANGLQGKVKPEELTTLEDREAIVRIGNHITKITTTDMKQIPEKNYKEEIIRRSRELYCRKTEDVKKIIRQRLNKWNPEYAQEQFNIEYNNPSQEIIIPSYDTFR